MQQQRVVLARVPQVLLDELRRREDDRRRSMAMKKQRKNVV